MHLANKLEFLLHAQGSRAIISNRLYAHKSVKYMKFLHNLGFLKKNNNNNN